MHQNIVNYNHETTMFPDSSCTNDHSACSFYLVIGESSIFILTCSVI